MRRVKNFKYVLGDSKIEAARIRRQAKLWDPVSKELFDRLNIRKDCRVLEVGPGMGSLHRELRKRVRGAIDAVEMSSGYCSVIQEIQSEDGFGPGTIWNTTLEEADLRSNYYDVIFLRWVFLFLPDTEKHLKILGRALKKGGRLAIQDYHRESFVLLPRPKLWSDFFKADMGFFARAGGDGSVAGKILDFLSSPRARATGLELIEFTPHLKYGHPGSPVWNWLRDFYVNGMDRYRTVAPFSASKAVALKKYWKALEKNPNAVVIAPTLVDLIIKKK